MTEFDANDALPDMEQFFQQGLDDQKAAEAEKELLPPSDSYISTPPLTVQGQVYKNDDGTERPVFTAFGTFVGRKEGKTIRQRIKFSSTLTKVAYDGNEPAFDSASKNYLLLRRAYQRVFGELPKTVGDIKNYLENYPLGFRGGQYVRRDTGEAAFSVFNIFAVTE